MIEGEPSVMHFAMAAAESASDNPKSVEHAKRLKDWPEWDKSIQKELDLHDKVGTWELVEPPPNANIIGSQLVLQYKQDAAGEIASRKTRFIAQGFLQTEGIDYNETFTPTAKLSAI